MLRVCAVERRRFPVGTSPTRQSLQPEATGAASRSRPTTFETSPCTPVTSFPISLAAAANSPSRRPVMKTCAPSFTNRFAVARPMPPLPPVTSAIFPSSLPMHLLFQCDAGEPIRYLGAGTEVPNRVEIARRASSKRVHSSPSWRPGIVTNSP